MAVNDRLGWAYGMAVFMGALGLSFLIGGIWKADTVRLVLGPLLLLAALASLQAGRRRRRRR